MNDKLKARVNDRDLNFVVNVTYLEEEKQVLEHIETWAKIIQETKSKSEIELKGLNALFDIEEDKEGNKWYNLPGTDVKFQNLKIVHEIGKRPPEITSDDYACAMDMSVSFKYDDFKKGENG